MIKKCVLLFLLFFIGSLSTIMAHVLTLSEAEHLAVTKGFEARTNYFEDLSKEWEKKNVITNYLLKIDYNLTYTRLDKTTVKNANSFSDFLTTIPGIPTDPRSPKQAYKNNFAHEVSINQPITNGGIEIFAIRLAKFTQAAIKYQMEMAQLEAIYTTRKAYFDVITAGEREKAAKQNLSWAKQNLSKAKTKHATGNISFTDVLQWEAEVSKKESEIIEANAYKKFVLLNLCQTMGSPEVKIDTLQLQPFEVFEKWYKKGMIATPGVIDSSYQFKMVKAYTKVAEENKNIALSAFLPRLNGFFNYTYNQGWKNKMSEISDFDFEPSWAAGFALNIPLFSGLSNPTSLKKSQYDYKKTVIEEKKVAGQLKVNLERIKLFYQASYESVRAAKKQRELMERQFEIMQKRYDGGLVNQSQLLEVSLGVHQTKMGYIQRLFECLLYEAEYLKNIGALEVTQ